MFSVYVIYFTIAVFLYQYLQVVLTVLTFTYFVPHCGLLMLLVSLMSAVIQGVIKEEGGGGSISVVLIPWGCILSTESEVSHVTKEVKPNCVHVVKL